MFGLLGAGDPPAGVPEEDMGRARGVVRRTRPQPREHAFSKKLDALLEGTPWRPASSLNVTKRTPEAARALQDAASLLRSARAYARVSKRPSIEGFLRAGKMAHVDTDTWAPSAPPAAGRGQLLTVHASQGLEFEAVFVSGLTEDRFPVGRGRATSSTLACSQSGAHTEDGARASPPIRGTAPALRRHHPREDLLVPEAASKKEPTTARRPPRFCGNWKAASSSSKKKEHESRFWTSRTEAVEELRRIAFDSEISRGGALRGQPRALVRREREAAEPTWWPYLEKTKDVTPQPEERLESRSWELVGHMGCPRRAFMERHIDGQTGRPWPNMAHALRFCIQRRHEALLSGEVRFSGGSGPWDEWRKRTSAALLSTSTGSARP